MHYVLLILVGADVANAVFAKYLVSLISIAYKIIQILFQILYVMQVIDGTSILLDLAEATITQCRRTSRSARVLAKQ